jgi:glycosyltransferase involved in cell wall biosynthesis
VPALSAFIIALDEADRIGAAIESLRGIAEEVVVVDSGSTDGTPEIAERLGARVIHRPWTGYGPQKRAGEDACRHDWLINLDADEALTPALAAEIAARAADGSLWRTPFWRMRIRDVFPHEDEPGPFAYGYNQIRLYDRRAGRFADSPVHDAVQAPKGAAVGQFRGAVAHRSIRSLAFAVEKMNRYTGLQAADMAARGRRPGLLRLAAEFPLAFLKAYLLRRFALRGRWGLIWSVTYAYRRFLRLAKLHEAALMAEAVARRRAKGSAARPDRCPPRPPPPPAAR